MNHPFRVGEKYFTPAQQKHIDEFLEKEPIPKDVWITKSGEKRKVVRVDFPEGTVRPGLTTYEKNKKSGETYYHTPSAKLPGREAIIIWVDPEDAKNQRVSTSSEWLKWAGGNFTVSKYTPVPLSEDEKKKQEATVTMLARNTKAPSDEGGAKWTKASRK